jgi:hypothetical protein
VATKRSVAEIGEECHDPNDLRVIIIPNSQIPLGHVIFVTTSRW